MPITISKLRINTISIERKEDNTGYKFSGQYSLVTNEDKVLAKQNFNTGYGSDIVINPSPQTVQALEMFLAAAQSDLDTMTGFK